MPAGFVQRTEAGGAEEDDGVLNALAAKTRQRLRVFGKDADDAAIGRVQKGRVFVGKRRGIERIRWIDLGVFRIRHPSIVRSGKENGIP